MRQRTNPIANLGKYHSSGPMKRGSATGAALARLPGMAIGGIVGLVRRRQLPVLIGVAPEAASVPLKPVALPLAGGVAILASYFTVVSSWMVSLLAK